MSRSPDLSEAPSAPGLWRSRFDLDSELIYLNSGTHSICSRAVLESVTRSQRAYERNPTEALIHAWPKLWRSQQALGRFLNASPSDLFFRVNVTHAMNDAILGLPLDRGDEILVGALEYGAVVNTCRFRAERDGLSVREARLPLDATDAEFVAHYADAISPRTRLLVASHVCTGTGHILPIAALAKLCRSRGVTLAVDGAHAAGALPLDFALLGDVDFYGGNLHKWVMGPKGTAFGWVSPSSPLRTTLQPLQAGWSTFERPDHFGEFGGGSRFAERFSLLGCHDFAPFFAISDALALWDELGPDRVRARIGELQAEAERSLAPLGWRRLSPPIPTRGPLLAYDLPERWQARGGHPLMADLLSATHVQVSVPKVQGRWALRVSPHIYNTVDEIREAATRLIRFFDSKD